MGENNSEKMESKKQEVPYNRLKEIWKKEFEKEDLQPLTEEEIEILRTIASMNKEDTDDTTINILQDKMMKIIEFYINDLAYLRLSKIISFAVKSKELNTLTPIEKQIYTLIREIIENYRNKLKQGDLGAFSIKTLGAIQVNPPDKVKEKREIVITKINLGDLVGTDGYIYKNIERKNIISLPKDNAEILEQRGVIQIIETGD